MDVFRFQVVAQIDPQGAHGAQKVIVPGLDRQVKAVVIVQQRAGQRDDVPGIHCRYQKINRNRPVLAGFPFGMLNAHRFEHPLIVEQLPFLPQVRFQARPPADPLPGFQFAVVHEGRGEAPPPAVKGNRPDNKNSLSAARLRDARSRLLLGPRLEEAAARKEQRRANTKNPDQMVQSVYAPLMMD